MDDNEKTGEASIPAATDAEVSSAAKQLGLSVGGTASSARKPRSGQVLQRLAHGRSHTVAVEIKLSRRRCR